MSETKNYIFIEGLEVLGYVGVYDHEKTDRQPLIISLNAEYLAGTQFHSDRLEDTINYEKFIAIINTALEHRHYNLIETLAEKIASEILGMDNIRAITIEIRKPKVLGVTSKGILGIKIKREL